MQPARIPIERLTHLGIEQPGAPDRLRAVTLSDLVLRLDNLAASFIGRRKESELLSVGQAGGGDAK